MRKPSRGWVSPSPPTPFKPSAFLGTVQWVPSCNLSPWVPHFKSPGQNRAAQLPLTSVTDTDFAHWDTQGAARYPKEKGFHSLSVEIQTEKICLMCSNNLRGKGKQLHLNRSTPLLADTRYQRLEPRVSAIKIMVLNEGWGQCWVLFVPPSAPNKWN